MEEQQSSVPGNELHSLMKPLFYIGGGDPETSARCPKVERDHVLMLALIPLCVFVYQAGIYGLTAHYLFAAPGTFRPDLILVGVFLAAFFLVQDAYVFNRAGAYAAGAFELGLKASPARVVKGALFAVIRLAEAVGVSQLCAVFFTLILFGHDIEIPIKKEWQRENATSIATASQPVDAEIRRQTDIVNTQAELVTQLTGEVGTLQQRQVDPYAGNLDMQEAQEELKGLIDQKVAADEAVAAAGQFASNELAGIKASPQNSGKPGKGPRRAAALEQLKNSQDRGRTLESNIGSARSRIDALRERLDANGTMAKPEAGLPAYKQSLAEARDKLNALEAHLLELANNRDAAIQAAVEKAPDYVPYDDGLLHRIVVLEQIINSDRKVFLMVLLIDLTALGIELSGVLAKLTVYIPSSYNALLVYDANLRIEDIADKLRKRFDDRDGDPARPPEPRGPNNPISTGDMFGPQPNYHPANDNVADDKVANDNMKPPKRKRGRPRKHPLPSGNSQLPVPQGT